MATTYDVTVVCITSDCNDYIDSIKYHDRVMMIMITKHIYYISHYYMILIYLKS